MITKIPEWFVDEHLATLSNKLGISHIGIDFLWGVYTTRNIAEKRPISFIDFENELKMYGCLKELA